jgi:hypothetical protein
MFFDLKKGSPMRNSILVCGAAAVVLACGGGGDGGGSNPAPAQPPAPLATLDNSNYTAAARDSLTAQTAIDLSSSLNPGSTSTTAQTLSVQPGQRRQALGLSTPPRAQVQQTTTQSLACDGGGSYSVSATIAGTELAAGDTFNMGFNNCIDLDDATTTNGKLDIAVLRWVGADDAVIFDRQISATETNLSVKQSTFSVFGNGTYTATLKSGANRSITATAYTQNFTSSITETGKTINRVLQNFAITWTLTPTGPVSAFLPEYNGSITLAGELTSSALGAQRVTVSTLQPLVAKNGDTQISSGQLLLTGANGSKVRITVQATGNALVELDTNGDGVYETQSVQPLPSVL